MIAISQIFFWTATVSLCLLSAGAAGQAQTPNQLDLENLDLEKLGLAQKLPMDLAGTNYNDYKELLKNKCVNVSGEETGRQAYTDLESGVGVLTECINGLINSTAMQQEIEEASPRGELDVVFNKYCNKRSSAVECFETFTAKLVPCLDKDEQESLDMMKRIVKSLLNFVCHKDGDQIALFIAEKGPECLESQKDNIMQCLNTTFSSYLNAGDLRDSSVKIESIPKLVMGQKQCDDIKNLETCVVEHLEHCSEITPANLVESMFNFIKNETLCRDSKGGGSSASKQLADNAASSRLLTISNTLYYLIVMIFGFYKLRTPQVL